MSATTKIWTNGIAPTCEDDDLNGFKNENNNLIIGSGQSLLIADNQQTHKAVAHYAGVGDFYVDSGVANAYVLGTTGSQVAPATYATGMRIRFVPGNTNGTGASTINVAGLGVKNLVQDIGGGDTETGDVPSGSDVEAYYDGTEFRLVNPLSNDTIAFTPILIGSGGGTPTYTTQQGSAQRMGRMVLAHGEIVISAVSTLSGGISVSLPSTPKASSIGPVFCAINKILNTGFAATDYFTLDYSLGIVSILRSGLGLSDTDLNANFRIEYTLMYFE